MHWVEHLQEPRDQDSEAGVDVEFNSSLFEAVRSHSLTITVYWDVSRNTIGIDSVKTNTSLVMMRE